VLLRYGAAAGLAAAAVLVRLAIDLVVTIDLPFLVFFPAILASALWFGVGPALFCTMLSGLAAAWHWIPPKASLAWRSASDFQGLVLFAISGVLMAWLVEASRRNRKSDYKALRDAAEQRRWQGEAERHMAELSRAVDVRTEELKEREALMQAVIETAVDAILTIDEQGIVRSFNQAAERMFGYVAGEVVGKNVNLLMPSPYREGHDSYVRHYLATGMKKIIGIGREIIARRKDGSTFPMHLSVSEVRLTGGRLFTGFIRDLTEQKRLEQEFLRSQKMEAIGSLSSAIAHDFNNILMGILGCSRVTATETQEAVPFRESLDEIAAAANRGVALTRRLLAFSRRAPLELRPTSIDEVVRENETMLRQLLGEDISLRFELSTGNASLLADNGLIEQIVINLLVNARDAMPGGGEIAVATRVDGEKLLLEVKDAGCGIPLELQPRIFEPFFTTKTLDKGTGLGLSTVKRITEQLQGHIDLESEPGQGTTFRLTFPRCEPPPRPRVGALEAKPPAAAPSGTVLLVEDDRLVRATLFRFLKGKGYAVLAASSPSEALDTASSQDSIDVLVTDMVLPEITGSELASRLRARAPSMKVIYMSAHPAEVLNAQGHLEAGAPCLEKPFEMEELESLLADVLADPHGAGAEDAPTQVRR
jgi:PAS domain S-box-containing protein